MFKPGDIVKVENKRDDFLVVNNYFGNTFITRDLSTKKSFVFSKNGMTLVKRGRIAVGCLVKAKFTDIGTVVRLRPVDDKINDVLVEFEVNGSVYGVNSKFITVVEREKIEQIERKIYEKLLDWI